MKLLLFDRNENYISTLKDVTEAKHTEEINGEDTLEISTLDKNIEKDYRIAYKDKLGYWKEFIVKEIENTHDSEGLEKTLFCESSFYEIIGDYIEERRPTGMASMALEVALEPTRWEVGTVDNLGTSSTNFYRISSKEAVQKVAEAWKGEIRTRVIVSGNKITRRYVDLLEKRGHDLGKRFTYTKDLESVIKTVHRDDVITALYGYGKGEEIQDDEGNLTGGYGRRIDFSELNNGKSYVENLEALEIWGRNNPNGTKSHVFGKVEFDDCEDKSELLELTTEKLEELSVPLVSYKAKVIDLGDADLGDTVAVIDKEFSPELRLKARVIKIVRDLLEEKNNDILLGNFIPSIVDEWNKQENFINNFRGKQGIWDRSRIIDNDGTINAQFLNNLVDELNNQMNSSGGYVFLSDDGKGLITTDKPTIEESTMAIQLLGGSFRIANSKLPNGEFDWRTFGDGNGFVADRFIGGMLQGGKVKFDLTNGTFLIGNSVEDYTFYFDGNSMKINLSGKPLEEVIDDIEESIENIELTPGPPGAPGKDGQDGYTPIKGVDYFDGVDGQDGQDGQSQYLWVRYSQNSNGDPFTTDPANAVYIGIAVTETPNPPQNHNSYTWSLVKGEDGIQGEKGEDGQTSYLHIKYSDDGGETFTGNNGEDLGEYIGMYVDFIEEDSDNPDDYTWNKIKGEQGIQGPQGEDGATLYTWVVYADDKNGSGITTNPENKDYIGIAYNKTTPTPSMTVSHYDFTKIKGEQGIAGSDAESYTWIVYASESDGTGISLSSDDKMYIGIAYNQDTPTPTLTPNLYQWSLMNFYVEDQLEGIKDTMVTEDELNSVKENMLTSEDLNPLQDALDAYKEALEADENALIEAVSNLTTLIEERETSILKELGETTERWNFINNFMLVGEEGLVIGTKDGSTAIMISPSRIDFFDGFDWDNPDSEDNVSVAHITGQLMEISRGIFVKSIQIGEHQIKTVDGHTIFSWMGDD